MLYLVQIKVKHSISCWSEKLTILSQKYVDTQTPIDDSLVFHSKTVNINILLCLLFLGSFPVYFVYFVASGIQFISGLLDLAEVSALRRPVLFLHTKLQRTFHYGPIMFKQEKASKLFPQT